MSNQGVQAERFVGRFLGSWRLALGVMLSAQALDEALSRELERR